MKAPALIACTIAAGLMLGAAVAWGQHAGHDKGLDLGDHDWIKVEPAYLMQRSEVHCCEMSHCRPIEGSDVQWTADGWLYKPTGQVFRQNERGTYMSRDPEGRFFGCGHERLWCFFYRPAGV